MHMFRFLLILALAFPLTAKAEPTCECTQPRSSDFHTTACPTISSTPADESKHVGRMWFQAIGIQTLMQLIAEYNEMQVCLDGVKHQDISIKLEEPQRLDKVLDALGNNYRLKISFDDEYILVSD